MKTTTYLRIFTMLLASAIFISCSKENLPLNGSNETINSANAAKPGPVFTYTGSITGILSPAPAIADIKVSNDDGSYSVLINSFPDGSFRVSNLPDDLYHLHISYIPGYSPVDLYSYFKVENIKIIQGMASDIGIVILP